MLIFIYQILRDLNVKDQEPLINLIDHEADINFPSISSKISIKSSCKLAL
jgi:hypothetical protein